MTTYSSLPYLRIRNKRLVQFDWHMQFMSIVHNLQTAYEYLIQFQCESFLPHLFEVDEEENNNT